MQTRKKELFDLIAGLSPLSASSLAAQLRTGDLAKDFKRRLGAGARREVEKRLLAVERTGALASLALQSDVGLASQRELSSALSRGLGFTSRATESNGVSPTPGVQVGARSRPGAVTADASGASLTKAWALEGRSIRLAHVRFARVYAAVSGEFSVTLAPTAGTGPHGVEFLQENAAAVEVRVVNALFGASVGVRSDRSAQGSRKISLTIEKGGFEFELSADPLSPLSVELPGLVREIDLGRDLPSLGVSGTAMIDVSIVVHVVPEYRRMLRAHGKQVTEAVRKGARGFGTRLVRLGRGVKSIVRAGLDGLKELSEAKKALKAGRKILALSKKPPGPTTPAMRLAGKTALAIDVVFLTKEFLDDLEALYDTAIVTLAHRALLDGFRIGYGSVLNKMTMPTWQSYYQQKSTQLHPAGELWDVRPPLLKLAPNKWVKGVPPEDAARWSAEHREATSVQSVSLATMNVQQRLLEIQTAALLAVTELGVLAQVHVAADIIDGLNTLGQPLDIFGSRKPALRPSAEPTMAAFAIIANEANIAGQASAFQDASTFIEELSEFGERALALDGMEVWDEVAEIHRAAFGDDFRQIKYYPLIRADGIHIVPFAD